MRVTNQGAGCTGKERESEGGGNPFLLPSLVTTARCGGAGGWGGAAAGTMCSLLCLLAKSQQEFMSIILIWQRKQIKRLHYCVVRSGISRTLTLGRKTSFTLTPPAGSVQTDQRKFCWPGCEVGSWQWRLRNRRRISGSGESRGAQRRRRPRSTRPVCWAPSAIRGPQQRSSSGC